jgi:hypothetical protein
MARYLDMVTQERVKALLALGWTERRVAREVGVHRNTVRRCAAERLAECTKTPTDPAAELGAGVRPPVTRRPFAAAPFRTEILDAIRTGNSAQVIYQGLVDRYGYAGSYDSVKLRASSERRIPQGCRRRNASRAGRGSTGRLFSGCAHVASGDRQIQTAVGLPDDALPLATWL